MSLFYTIGERRRSQFLSANVFSNNISRVPNFLNMTKKGNLTLSPLFRSEGLRLVKSAI